MSDPILEALARIEAKQDDLLANQARMDEELQQIKKDCKKETGDDWDKVRAAYTLAGGGIEDLSRSLLAGFLMQYQSTMTMLQDTSVEELMPSERAKLLASLSDAFTKTVAANKRVLPEVQESAIAIKVIEKLFAYIADQHTDMLAAFDTVLQGFQTVIEKEF